MTQSFINTCSIERIESLARLQIPLPPKEELTKSVSEKESLPSVQVIERNDSLVCEKSKPGTKKDSPKTVKKSSPKEDVSIESVEVQDIINKYAMKTDIHNALVKQFGAEVAQVIYPQIKKKLTYSSSKTLSIDSKNVQEIIQQCSSAGEIHNRLMTKYGAEKTKMLYPEVKKRIEAKQLILSPPTIESAEVQVLIKKHTKKQDLHQALSKKFGTKITQVLYPQIKATLT